MYYVYYLESEDRNHWYIGLTNNLERRLSEHNAGESIHTNKHKPWTIINYTAFKNKTKAEAYEQYLKSKSGRAFAKKHF